MIIMKCYVLTNVVLPIHFFTAKTNYFLIISKTLGSCAPPCTTPMSTFPQLYKRPYLSVAVSAAGTGNLKQKAWVSEYTRK
jgi:hypothetical protein